MRSDRTDVRYGMAMGQVIGHPDDEFRYRAIEVLGVDEDGRIMPGEVREYKTVEGANACVTRWREAGRAGVQQAAKVHWLTQEEIEDGGWKPSGLLDPYAE